MSCGPFPKQGNVYNIMQDVSIDDNEIIEGLLYLLKLQNKFDYH